MAPLSFVSPESSHIMSAVYYPNLYYIQIKFRNKENILGSDYLYLGVPRSVWDEFEKAPSKGKFFNLHIADKFSEWKRVPSHPTGWRADKP